MPRWTESEKLPLHDRHNNPGLGQESSTGVEAGGRKRDEGKTTNSLGEHPHSSLSISERKQIDSRTTFQTEPPMTHGVSASTGTNRHTCSRWKHGQDNSHFRRILAQILTTRKHRTNQSDGQRAEKLVCALRKCEGHERRGKIAGATQLRSEKCDKYTVPLDGARCQETSPLSTVVTTEPRLWALDSVLTSLRLYRGCGHRAIPLGEEKDLSLQNTRMLQTRQPSE